jgi:hypothetical protein
MTEGLGVDGLRPVITIEQPDSCIKTVDVVNHLPQSVMHMLDLANRASAHSEQFWQCGVLAL